MVDVDAYQVEDYEINEQHWNLLLLDNYADKVHEAKVSELVEFEEKRKQVFPFKALWVIGVRLVAWIPRKLGRILHRRDSVYEVDHKQEVLQNKCNAYEDS